MHVKYTNRGQLPAQLEERISFVEYLLVVECSNVFEALSIVELFLS